MIVVVLVVPVVPVAAFSESMIVHVQPCVNDKVVRLRAHLFVADVCVSVCQEAFV